MLGHLLHAVERLVDLAGALKAERNGYDTHGEDAHLLAHLSDDGSGSGACSATHTCGDERHLRAVVEHAAYVVDALCGCLTGALGTVAGSKAFLAELQMHGHGTVVEGLCVGVTEHKGHVVYAFAIHVVDRIAAASTNTNHLDDAVLLVGRSEIEDGGSAAVYDLHVVIFVCHNGHAVCCLNVAACSRGDVDWRLTSRLPLRSCFRQTS